MAKQKKKKKQSKRNIKLLKWGVIAVVLFIIFYFLNGWFASELPREPEVHVTETQVEAFSEILRKQVNTEIGRPIEGYTPDMFRRVYTDLSESDFEGVEAVGGVYRYTIEDEIAFEEKGESMKTSADQTITDEGMKTLLKNVGVRLRIDFDEADWLDEVLERITGPGGIDADNEIVTGIDQGIFLHGAKITPVEVLEDSRCPEDTECVQAGTVRVKAEVSTGEEKTRDSFTLGETEEALDYFITLVEVTPRRESNSDIGKEEYQFHFLVKKKNSEESD